MKDNKKLFDNSKKVAKEMFSDYMDDLTQRKIEKLKREQESEKEGTLSEIDNTNYVGIVGNDLNHPVTIWSKAGGTPFFFKYGIKGGYILARGDDGEITRLNSIKDLVHYYRDKEDDGK